MNMNIVESKLFFSTPPMSIKTFNQQKSLSDIKQYLDKATLYIIAKRETPQLQVVDHSSIEEHLNGYDQNTYIILNFKMEEAGFDVDIAYFLPENLKKEKLLSSISELTIEEILYYNARKYGNIGCFKDISTLITYEVLYVGQCVGEPLTKRFKAHHALQKLLIEEEVISKKYDKADELLLMPLSIDSNTSSVLTPGSTSEDFVKVFSNSLNFGSREVILDAEKALVHNLNPKYNRIKFLDYPKSKNGLYNTDANAYSYSIAETVLLKYENGVVMGCPDVHYASRIVGDDEGFTKIYNPGEDITKKYISRIMSYMDEVNVIFKDGEKYGL